MKRTTIKFIAITGLLIVGALGFSYFSTPTLPPLLQGQLSTTGGFADDCQSGSVSDEEFRKRLNRIHSPELEARLDKLFPAGSSETTLADELRAMGFTVSKAYWCKESTINFARYDWPGSLIPLRYQMMASIRWKADESGRLIWVEGNVSYTGP